MTTRFGAELGIQESFLGISITGGGASLPVAAKLGARLGGVADLSFNEHFSLQPGLAFSMKGGGSLGGTDWGINYIEIPVNLVVKLENPNGNSTSKWFLGAGPYLGVAMSAGSALAVGKSSTIDTTGSGNDTYGIKAFDFGIQIVAGREWEWGFYTKASYGLGLMDISYDKNNSNLSLKNYAFSFSVGYLFGSSR